MGESVETFLESIDVKSPEIASILHAALAVVRRASGGLPEQIKYGGVMFDERFGVFPYTKHVTVEFSNGIELDDPAGVLKGSGKRRRHIVLTAPADVAATVLEDYVRRAVSLSDR